MRILAMSFLATLAFASTAQANDTHGCSAKIDKLPVQIIATKNLRCRDAVPFMLNHLNDGTVCAAGAKNRRCVDRVRGYVCASRFYISKVDVVMAVHCMKGPSRRIGLTYSWAAWSRARGRH